MYLSKPINNTLLLIILSAIWGSSFFVIKIGLNSFSPISVASLRLITASIFLLLFYYSFNSHPKLNLNLIIIFTFIGVTGNFLPFYLISWAEQYILSSTAGLLMSVGPIMTLVMSHLLTSDDKFTKNKLISVIIGLVGIYLILDIKNYNNFNDANMIVTLSKFFVILAAFGYMISNIAAYNKLKNTSPITITTFATFFGALFSLPFFIYDLSLNSNSFDLNSISAIIYLGIFPTALAFHMRYYIVKISGPVFLSYVAYLIPVFALIWGYLFLSEKIELNSFFGIILVFIGLFIGQKSSMSKISIKNI